MSAGKIAAVHMFFELVYSTLCAGSMSYVGCQQTWLFGVMSSNYLLKLFVHSVILSLLKVLACNVKH